MSNHFDDEYHEDFDENHKSKSQLKREMHALQALGEKLTHLPKKQLASLDIPDTLRQAISDYQSFKSNIAKKRQLQFIGKVMRSVDPEPIEVYLEKLESRQRDQTRQFHHLEQWRDRLLQEGDSALGELLNEAPQIDRQQLRQLIRNAQKEAAANKPPRAAREIFQLLKEQLLNP